jgi:hypothetical protein
MLVIRPLAAIDIDIDVNFGLVDSFFPFLSLGGSRVYQNLSLITVAV